MLSLTSNIHHYAEVPSTNRFAAELLRNGPIANGTVILTDSQTQGLGQQGHVWVSQERMNLTFTIIYIPSNIKADEQFALTMAVASALQKYLSVYSPHITIKWPNDLLAGEKKIAGILIENALLGNRITSSLLGIGININQEVFPSFDRPATSLKEITGCEADRLAELRQILQHIEIQLGEIESKGGGSLTEEYTRNLYLLGEIETFESTNGLVNGKICGVNHHGQLLIETVDNRQLIFNHREITFTK